MSSNSKGIILFLLVLIGIGRGHIQEFISLLDDEVEGSTKTSTGDLIGNSFERPLWQSQPADYPSFQTQKLGIASNEATEKINGGPLKESLVKPSLGRNRQSKTIVGDPSTSQPLRTENGRGTIRVAKYFTENHLGDLLPSSGPDSQTRTENLVTAPSPKSSYKEDGPKVLKLNGRESSPEISVHSDDNLKYISQINWPAHNGSPKEVESGLAPNNLKTKETEDHLNGHIYIPFDFEVQPSNNKPEGRFSNGGRKKVGEDESFLSQSRGNHQNSETRDKLEDFRIFIPFDWEITPFREPTISSTTTRANNSPRNYRKVKNDFRSSEEEPQTTKDYKRGRKNPQSFIDLSSGSVGSPINLELSKE